jgi:predicted Rossmann fold flavoprotein
MALLMTKIAIIGGGAAGLMAAARIVELVRDREEEVKDSPEIFLIERNKVLGKKVMMSGGGRCNFTTGLEDLKEVLKRYPRGGRFLRTAMHAFPPADMCVWLEEHGVPVKCENDMRVFPKSNNGAHVVRAIEKVLDVGGVKVLFETSVSGFSKEGEEFVLDFGEDSLRVNKVILCVGGKAYGRTGSQGDGYSFAEGFGHKITDLAPSLSAFVLGEKWLRDLAGVAFETVSLNCRGQSFSGPIMFSHKGMTGPAVFALSALLAYENFDRNASAELFVDFFPGENYEECASMLKAELEANSAKAFRNVLAYLLPKSFVEVLCQQLSVDVSKRADELSKKDLNRVVDALKNLKLSLVGRVPGDEFVTAGGIALEEVDVKTMQSKICPGLYFAGELLDYDGFTGGFNLQAAWATGRLAGESTLSKC